MKSRIRVAALACASCLAAWAAGAGAQDVSKSAGAAALFDKHCDTCHGRDGRAKTFKAKFNHARDLTDAAWQADVTDEHLFNSIARGRGKMPAFGKKLTTGQIESLVAYVRGLKR